jgi:serine protease
MKKNLLFLLLILIIPVLNSYKAPRNGNSPYVEGQIMIKLHSDLPYSQQQMLNDVLSDFQSVDLGMIQMLSNRLNIFLLSYDPSTINDDRLLQDIKDHPFVELAQFNHYIGQRELIPNDESFGLQWNMKNIGQNGGIAGSDIDATYAWDRGTSGVTASGDTIIVAIVDDGFDLTHADIHFWKNHDEIPGNGIDDDGNGYIDDYDGWNTWQNNGTIEAKDHGTHVSGIAAARGNNNIGVTGVNWNVQVMAVEGSATIEAPVVAAYAYITEMKSLYIETNGAKGAFVVATNASFGVNNGLPEDFPIWGAMYDTLGMRGILSAAATANADWNVDEVGDIPTTFTSDFLISVTNTDNSDLKSNSAGYGPVSIDLGAPGTQIYSTRINGQYGYKTGTSMASPHVTGAVAYMFSVATQDFMTQYKNDPAGMALVIKEYLLDGTDPLPTLQGKTVSGGRLNIDHSAQLMLDPALELNPLSVLMALPPNAKDSATLALTNTNNSPVDYTFAIETLDWLSLSGPVHSTLGPYASDTIRLHFNSNGHQADTLFTYMRFYWGVDGITNVPVHFFIDPNVGINEQGCMEAGKHGGMEVWPNPAESVLSVKCLGLSEGKSGIVSIYDISGKKVKENSISSDKELKINVEDLKSGVYFAIIMNGTNIMATDKFLIKH